MKLNWSFYVKCQMPNAKCQMPNAKCQIPNVKCQMPNAKCQMPNAKCQMPNVKCQMPNAKCQMPNGRCRWHFVLPMILMILMPDCKTNAANMKKSFWKPLKDEWNCGSSSSSGLVVAKSSLKPYARNGGCNLDEIKLVHLSEYNIFFFFIKGTSLIWTQSPN